VVLAAVAVAVASPSESILAPLHDDGAAPAGVHVRRLGLGPGPDDLEVLLLAQGQFELPKDVVVKVPILAAFAEEHGSVLEPDGVVIARDEVGAHAKHDGERVCVGVDVDLLVEPHEGAEGHGQGLLPVLLVLGEGACLMTNV